MIIFRALKFPAAVLLAYALLILLFDINETAPWADIPFHLVGGASIACAAFLVLKEYNYTPIDKKVFAVLLLGIVAIAAIGWEVFEFTLQLIWPPERLMKLPDTIMDLVMGLSGGLGAAIVLALVKQPISAAKSPARRSGGI